MQTTNALDCSKETSPPPTLQTTDKAWLRDDVSKSDWLFAIDDEILRELDQLALSLQPDTEPHQLVADNFDLPASRDLFKRIKHTLDYGIGFAVADRLPVEKYDPKILLQLFYILGTLVGRPVAQKHNGEMIYSVKDTGHKLQYGVRGSWTNVELNFHTDNAFGSAPPEYVGLYCKHPAKSGGISRFCSLYSIHNKLQEINPAALSRLYQPMYYDRQKEHAEGAPPVTYAPFFTWHGNRLNARANTSLVRKGYEVAGVAMDEELSEALNCMDEVSAAPQFWYEAELEQGQIQYLNNSEVGHYRSEFTDHEEEHKKRHLYRLWHRDTGTATYHGL